MGKFVYLYNANGRSIQVAETIVKNFFLPLNDYEYFVKKEKELLYINNVNGIQTDSFDFLCGAPDFAIKISNQKFFSFKFQVTTNTVELTPDQTASRSVWYVVNSDRIIVSSSQRLIIQLLKSFDLNMQAVSWFVTTGCTGPANSWDKRIKHLSPKKKIVLSKRDFSETITECASDIVTAELNEIMEKVFSAFDPNKKWGVTLSGGYDSRAVATALVKCGVKPRAFTWGTEDSILRDSSDSAVAKKVANRLSIPFTFIGHSPGVNAPESVFSQYLQAGEGRIDHINSFTDGLNFWKTIYDSDIHAIVRADEAFGWLKVSNEKDVRISLDVNHTTDYHDLQAIFNKGLEIPQWPDFFHRLGHETLAQWRDRLYRTYRIPYILSALHDLMLLYAEIMNPLLYDPFIEWIKRQSDEDRSDKRKYKTFVDKLLPGLEYSKSPAVPEPEAVLTIPRYRDYILETLMSKSAEGIFGTIAAQMAEKLHSVNESRKSFSYIQRTLPYGLKKILRRTVLPYQLDRKRIVLRLFLVSKMVDILRRDSNMFL